MEEYAVKKLCAVFLALAEDNVGNYDQTAEMLRGIELQAGERYKVDGEYSIEYKSATWFSDEQLTSGWYCYYLTNEDADAETVRYEHPIGTTMSVVIRFTYTNRSKENVNVLKNVRATLIFDRNISLTRLPLQYNPNQAGIVDDRKEQVPSTAAIDTEPLVAMDICFMTYVPLAVRDAEWPLDLHLMIDESDSYVVDIRGTATVCKEGK